MSYAETINLCKFDPCENGATCIHGYIMSAYICVCLPGYTGEHCETVC